MHVHFIFMRFVLAPLKGIIVSAIIRCIIRALSDTSGNGQQAICNRNGFDAQASGNRS